MVAQTTTRKKGTDVYRYGVYRCGFAKTKGPAICAHGTGQASHLVRFLATGGDSPAVRAELRTIETRLQGLRAEWATIEKASALPPPRVHPAWVRTKLERLDELLRRDSQRVKVEILKHLDGDLVIVPRPSPAPASGGPRLEAAQKATAS